MPRVIGAIFMDNSIPGFNESQTEYVVTPSEGLIQRADPLDLGIEDDELHKIIDKRVEDSKKFFDKVHNLTERRKKNELFYLGKQVDEKEKNHEIKPYEARYMDNAIYEIEASLKPLAMSRLPDLIVTPGGEELEQKETSKSISEIVNDDLKKRENRKVLALAFKHNPIYFVGVIKAIWDPERDDYRFVVRHPNNIVVDSTCSSSDADDMSFVCEYVPMTIQEIIMTFPDKKDELMVALQKEGLVAGKDPTWKEMGSTIKIKEIWFTWYKKKGSKELSPTAPIKEEWEKVEGVAWKYNTVLFKKIKNPNFDYQGYKEFFTLDPEGNKKKLEGEDLMGRVMTGSMEGIIQDQVYRNYFDRPKKPYYFVTYDQLGKIALDETSRIEQNIRNQENNDNIGKRIIEKLKNRGKHIFSKDGGIKAEDVERMDMDNDRQDLLVDGNVNEVHNFIQPIIPTAQEFNALQLNRQRMYSLAGANAIRGEMQSDVATTNQIAREADFTRADDLVEDTINAASEWMARYAMQFIKLRYTKDHFRKVLGAKGQTAFIRLNSDLIEDGMEVKIKSSGTDKIKAQRNAMEMAKAGLTEPLSFFEDMGMSDPEGRTERLLLFKTNPAMYLAKYVQKLQDTQGLAGALGQLPVTQMEPSGNMPSAPVEPAVPNPAETSQVPTIQPPIPESSVRNL